MTAPKIMHFGRVFGAFMESIDGIMAMSFSDLSTLTHIASYVADVRVRWPLNPARLRTAMRGAAGETEVIAFSRRCPFVHCYTVGGKEYATIPSFAALARHPSIAMTVESSLPAPAANDHMDEALAEALRICSDVPGNWWDEPNPRYKRTGDGGNNGAVQPNSGGNSGKVPPKAGGNSESVPPNSGGGGAEFNPEPGRFPDDLPPNRGEKPRARVQVRGTERNGTERNSLAPKGQERVSTDAGPVPAPTPPGPEGPGSARAARRGEPQPVAEPAPDARPHDPVPVEPEPVVVRPPRETPAEKAERKAREREQRLADAKAKYATVIARDEDEAKAAGGAA